MLTYLPTSSSWVINNSREFSGQHNDTTPARMCSSQKRKKQEENWDGSSRHELDSSTGLLAIY